MVKVCEESYGILPWYAPIPVDFLKQEPTDYTEDAALFWADLYGFAKFLMPGCRCTLTSASSAAQFHDFGGLRFYDDHLRLLPAARRELSVGWQRNAAGNSGPRPHRR